MKKILMVCLGNICRSPLAEGILRDKIDKVGINAVVDSCGTSAWHVGEQPDDRAQAIARKYGIDISDLRGRQFTQSDFDKFDLIYAMDSENLSGILRLARNENDKKKVDLILNATHPGKNMSVPDPYYGGKEGFENIFKLLDAACDKIIEDLLK